MAPIGTLWGAIRQPLTRIILSVAALNELELERPEWTFEKKPEAFTSQFPYGKIPAFEGADGFKLTEGTTIARYLCGLGTKVNLLGTDSKESILIDQWIHFAEQEIGGPIQYVMGLVYGFAGPFSVETLDRHVERLVRAMEYAESYLASRPSGYLVSDSLTLADIVFAAMTHTTALAALGATERAKYPAVFGHLEKTTRDERLKQFWGRDMFTEVAAREPRTLPTS